MSPDTCPNCGADVPPKAKACPECGACEQTGWSENADVGDLGIPEESFDYNEFVKREFGAKRILPRGIGWFWWAVSLAAVGALLWLVLR
jgi:zinc-ribbon domain